MGWLIGKERAWLIDRERAWLIAGDGVAHWLGGLAHW